MNATSPSEGFSRTELAILRLLVLVYPATLSIEYLRHRLSMHISPRDEANSLASRGLIEQVDMRAGRLEEWRATRAGIDKESQIARQHPEPERIPLGRYRPRGFNHMCPPGCSE